MYDMRSMCAQTDKVSSCPSQGFGQTRRLVVIIAKSVGGGGSLQQYGDMRRLRWIVSVVACNGRWNGFLSHSRSVHGREVRSKNNVLDESNQDKVQPDDESNQTKCKVICAKVYPCATLRRACQPRSGMRFTGQSSWKSWSMRRMYLLASVRVGKVPSEPVSFVVSVEPEAGQHVRTRA